MTKKIGIIIGSTRPNRISMSIATLLQTAMAQSDLQIDLIDLADIQLPFLDEVAQPSDGHYELAHTKA